MKPIKYVMAGLMLSLAVVFAANCGEKAESAGARSMIIVAASSEVVIERDGQEIPAKVGMIVQENDIVRTQGGKVDLQTRNGSAVRIREYSTVTVSSLYGEGSTDTRLTMNHGGVMARVNRQSSDEDFSVVTPTAIAGVRGTTFTVEAEEGQPARVRVIDGQVAMAPRIAALDNASEEQIAEDEDLRELAQIRDRETQVLEREQEGQLDDTVEQTVAQVNRQYDAAPEDQKQAEETESRNALVAALGSDAEPSEQRAVVVTRAEVSAREVAETATLVTVDEDIFNRVESGEQSALQELEQQRSEKQEEVLQEIERAAEDRGLQREEDILEQYGRIEVIETADGTYTGAVIAQTGDMLMIHTAEGVKRVNTSDVRGHILRDQN